jgi:hypothetical protein
VDGEVVVPPPGGAEATRDMPRVHYRGVFDPVMIPLLNPVELKRPDIAGYKAVAGPKAAALHDTGRLYIITKAPDQRDAEDNALAECNRDRKGAATPCYLYAARDRVILPLRLTAPRPPATTVADALLLIAGTDRAAENYRGDRAHRALVLELDGARVFRYSGAPDARTAEQMALEFCQIRWNTPCVVVAVDDELKTPDPYVGQRRSAPRLAYTGPYRPEMVPLFASHPVKELAEYAAMGGARAMAIGAVPPRARVASGATNREAEAKALAACNDPPDSPIPCILYAVDDRVVLPSRRTEPMP